MEGASKPEEGTYDEAPAIRPTGRGDRRFPLRFRRAPVLKILDDVGTDDSAVRVAEL
jgi:hypothetical protein